jgi:hypothetical protein
MRSGLSLYTDSLKSTVLDVFTVCAVPTRAAAEAWRCALARRRARGAGADFSYRDYFFDLFAIDKI